MTSFEEAYKHMARNEGGFTWKPAPAAKSNGLA